MADLQTVDPEVSRVKFERELANYRSMESAYRKRGWILLDAAFPEIFVVFAATKPRPPPIVAAIVLNFTDYDLRPPSVRFVDPFTREPIPAKSLLIQMLRRPSGLSLQEFATMLQQGAVPRMIQWNSPEDQPFVCLPGVREYHDNPAHTGDSWLLHRSSGEGSLPFILEKVWYYGVSPIDRYQVQVQVPMEVQVPELNVLPSLLAVPE
ncbi:putative metal-binding protein [Bradyrhizobium murdochi]|uniref:putative metal-binding protein n=1 Tax=Bradyrhizobium murdochi TaxID=1038859 RepID=UPI000426E183|nr:putative metal-binding protein [Bradyrhizobium murdochi]